tara:strand:+ start:2048 stop:2689 length:642 start_codon:yes stop_codon:yes gene_type:complete
MKYNAIFIYRDVINLGPVNPFTTPSIATMDNTNYSDNIDSIDWSAVKLKRGDNIFYNKKDTDSTTGRRLKTTTPTSIGVISTEPATTRITVGANVGDDVYNDFLNGNVNIYAVRSKNLTGRKIYSYPTSRYVGACDFTDSIISLFFERTSGMIDEVRINVKKLNAYSAIAKINEAFVNGIKGNIVFDETDSSVKSNVIYGVNKVISTIPSNRN